MNTCFKLSVLASALALAMGPASAEDVYLAAKEFSKDLPLSGGETQTVPMWGYVEDTGGTDIRDNSEVQHCYDIGGAGSPAARKACVEALPLPESAIPGPRVAIAPEDRLLRIYLTNALPVPTSIVIPGQAIPFSSSNANVAGPVWSDGSHGARGTNMTKRVRSYGAEAGPDGGKRAYVWANSRGTELERTGSFIYHSGTSPQLQVYMGLYGAVTKDAAAADVVTGTSAEAFTGVPYDNEVILFYSDIDPAHNTAVANGDETYTPIHYNAKWFLVNGEPYQANVTEDIPAGSAVIDPNGDTRSDTLVRLLSTASETHVPTLQGLYMNIHAEDGFRYEYQNGDVRGGFTPREQYSAMLPPLKTKDAIVVAEAEGRYAVYDGNGYMTNPSDTTNFGQADELGGMLRFLSVGAANQAPVAVDDSVTTDEDTPVDINVVANDSDPNGDGLTIISVTQGSVGSVSISDSTCCVLYTPNQNVYGLDSFKYTVTDSNGVISTATALVNITVAAVNDPPTITSTPTGSTATTGALYTGTVTATDIDLGDPTPDVLSFSLETGFPVGMLINSTTGEITWTPTVQQNQPSYDVTAVVTDSGSATDTQLFTIDLTLVNNPPTIDSTATTTATVNAAYSYDVKATDGDPGEILTYSLDQASLDRGMTIDAGTGAIEWTPTLFQLGPHDVTASVTDFNGEVATQAYTVSVGAAGSGADGPMFFSTAGNVVVPGVAGTNNNADVYAYDGAVYSRILDSGFAGNIDALHVVDADTFYVSFANDNGVTNGGLTLQDEDIGLYDSGTWTMYFDGSVNGLGTGTGWDLDAISIDGGVLYFSTNGNVNVGGLGSGDDADIYSWNGAVYTREFDASANGLPGNADIDGLTVRGTITYMSFNRNGGTAVPTVGTVQDEAVVSFDGANWTLYSSGPGLNASNGHDIDALDLP